MTQKIAFHIIIKLVDLFALPAVLAAMSLFNLLKISLCCFSCHQTPVDNCSFHLSIIYRPPSDGELGSPLFLIG